MRMLATLSWLLAVPALAEDSEAVARGLMTRAVQALGGEAHEGVRSLRAVADCTHGDSEFSTEVISRRPDRTIFAQRAGDRAMELWVVGEEGFLLNPATGERRPLTESERAMARGHEFHFLLFELDQRFKNPRVVGTETAAGRACTAVAAEDEAGRPASICFDRGNGLPLVLTHEPPGGAPGTIRMVLEDWRKIDGVQFLAAFTLYQGDDAFTYRYHTLEPNSVPEDRFDRARSSPDVTVTTHGSSLPVGPKPVADALGSLVDGKLPWTDLEVTYDDLHGLHGGLRLTLRGDGTVEQEVVRTSAGVPRQVDEAGLRSLVELLLTLEAWRQDEEERPLLPDESQARLVIRVGRAESEIWEWFNDLKKNDRLLRIREKLKALAWASEE